MGVPQLWLMRKLPDEMAYLNDVHGEELTQPTKRPVRRRLYRQRVRCLRKADLNVIVNRYSAKIAPRLSGASEHNRLGQSNFVDHVRFRPPADRKAVRKRLGWAGKLIVLTNSPMTPRKGIDQALRALAGADGRTELPFCYGAADMFLHPNRHVEGDFDGYGLVFWKPMDAERVWLGAAPPPATEAIVDVGRGLVVDGKKVGGDPGSDGADGAR